MEAKLLSSLVLASMAIVLVFGPNSVSALHCWQCNTASDKNCDSLPAGPVANVSTLSECIQKYYVECKPDENGSQPFCRKQEQTIQTVKRTVRGCAYQKATQNSYTVKNPAAISVVNQCFTDGCNGAFAVKSSFGLFIFVAVLTRIFLAH